MLILVGCLLGSDSYEHLLWKTSIFLRLQTLLGGWMPGLILSALADGLYITRFDFECKHHKSFFSSHNSIIFRSVQRVKTHFISRCQWSWTPSSRWHDFILFQSVWDRFPSPCTLLVFKILERNVFWYMIINSIFAHVARYALVWGKEWGKKMSTLIPHACKVMYSKIYRRTWQSVKASLGTHVWVSPIRHAQSSYPVAYIFPEFFR